MISYSYYAGSIFQRIPACFKSLVMEILPHILLQLVYICMERVMCGFARKHQRTECSLTITSNKKNTHAHTQLSVWQAAAAAVCIIRVF